MRSKLGRIVTLSVAGATLIVAATSGAVAGAPPDDSAPETSAPDTTEPATSEPATAEPVEEPPTTTPPPTTTEPQVADPMIVELPAKPSRVTPSRGTQKQVTDTLPLPETTTTTTIPPSWVLPANSGSGRRVVYSKSRMRLWAVDADGTVAKTHLVSGRRTWNQPSPGTYSVFSRSTHTCNINNPHICWRYMVRFAKGPGGDNIGFHEIPVNRRTGNKLQSVSQLGQALSGGCVRQSTPDAQYMWGWAPIGTPVVVLG